MSRLPFTVFRREGRRFYYVKFKDSQDSYFSAVSTKETSEAAAIEVAFKWLREGRPQKDKTVRTVTSQELLHSIKAPEEVEFLCRELKRQGLIKNYIMPESQQAVDFPRFLDTFWDYDVSPYIKEKLRRDHGIHKNYTIGQRLITQKEWSPFFQGRLLGDLTHQDIERFIEALADRTLSPGRKNKILQAGVIPLRWAFTKELLEKDITTGITWFSGKTAKRHILSPEMVGAIFRVIWKDERSRLANMLAAVTGLRAGEIQGMRMQDLGHDCLYIKHSWNFRDGLKTTKNNEMRTVEVPFPHLLQELLILAERNPHGANMDSYVFWGEKIASKPMESRLFLDGLRDALLKIGMSQQSAAQYVFHGWRHFFTAYMRDKLNEKLLRSQTGHKTLAMLNHYSEHQLSGEREKVRQAQREAFGNLITQ